jgi:hypothetical protein
MTPLERAVTHYIEARLEDERWEAICTDWMKVHGRGIWRERHPEDLDKLAHRRFSRKCLRIARCQLEDALEDWCPFKSAFEGVVPPTVQHLADLAKTVVQ